MASKAKTSLEYRRPLNAEFMALLSQILVNDSKGL
jgi:hypothetical protein